jgi:gluconolactonase
VFDIETLTFQGILAEENSDGIKCDHFGNVYLSNKDGLLILNTSGNRAALIQLPTIPANHCFGGNTKTDLFITGREKVYRIRNLVKEKK